MWTIRHCRYSVRPRVPACKSEPRRQLHIVVDNYSAHNHADVKKWLAKN